MTVENQLEEASSVMAKIPESLIDVVTILTAITLFFVFVQIVLSSAEWYRARSYRVAATAKLPVINLNKEKFPLNIAVVNNGERQFSIDRIGICLNSKHSKEVTFDISLTEIGKAKLEDGDKINESLDVRRYLDNLSEMIKKNPIKFDECPPNRLEMFFMTTTEKKIPIKLPVETKMKIISQLLQDGTFSNQ